MLASVACLLNKRAQLENKKDGFIHRIYPNQTLLLLNKLKNSHPLPLLRTESRELQ